MKDSKHLIRYLHSTSMRAFFLLSAFGGGWFFNDGANAETSKIKMSAWIVYWDQNLSVQSLKNNLAVFDTVLFFNYALDETGRVVENEPLLKNHPWIMPELQKEKRVRLATIVNDVINSKGGRATLKDPNLVRTLLTEKKAQHIADIIHLCDSEGFEGIDIDYENLFPEDKELFSTFVQDLADGLHKKGKILSVTVQQKVKESKSKGPGAMDYAKIGQAADEVRIMCYNFSSQSSAPGPVSPPDWLRKIITYAKTQVPVEKLNIVLGLQGFDWAKSGSKSITYAQAMERSKKFKGQPEWDQASSTPHFKYQDESGQAHEIWFENQDSFEKKLDILKAEGIRRMTVWRLGQEDAGVHEKLKKLKSS